MAGTNWTGTSHSSTDIFYQYRLYNRVLVRVSYILPVFLVGTIRRPPLLSLLLVVLYTFPTSISISARRHHSQQAAEEEEEETKKTTARIESIKNKANERRHVDANRIESNRTARSDRSSDRCITTRPAGCSACATKTSLRQLPGRSGTTSGNGLA